MNSNELFSLKRFFLLTREAVSLRTGRWAITLAVAAILVALFTFAEAVGDSDRGNEKIFGMLVFILGIVFTSRSFAETKDRTAAYAWFTLPGSVLEKFLSRLFITSIGFILVLTITCTISANLSEGLIRLFWDSNGGYFNPLTKNALIIMAVYLVVQSVTLVGAAYFKKAVLGKTYLVLSLFNLVLFLVALLAARIVFWDFFDGFWLDFDTIERITESVVAGQLDNYFVNAGKVAKWILGIVFWVIIVPLCWTIVYFRLKETEV
jgi:hypothetical protein